METIRELVSRGKEHFRRREFLEAEGCLRKVLQQNTAYADVYHMMGVIHHAEGRFSSAIDSFQKALKLNPHYTEAALNLAVLYNDLGRYKDAKQLYTHLRKGPPRSTRKEKSPVKIDPVLRGRLANMHAEVGDIYRDLGMYDQAIEEYRRALAVSPTYADILTKLGVALREEGELEKSRATLVEACKENGQYLPARVQLGVTYYTLGKAAEAQKEWRTVLKNDANNDLAKMYLRLCEPQTQG